MTDNSETSEVIKPEPSVGFKIIRVLEVISFVVMLIPYGLMVYWILSSALLKSDNFSLFPTALYMFLPTGAPALFVQLARYFEVRPTDDLSLLKLGCSVFAVVVGILAYMLLYIVVA